MDKNFAFILAASIVTAAIAGAMAAKYGQSVYAVAISVNEQHPNSLMSPKSQSCDIKGNISINSGERIYHVPGQEFYDETIIRTEYGERWFCTEDEAKSAGWRKAKN